MRSLDDDHPDFGDWPSDASDTELPGGGPPNKTPICEDPEEWADYWSEELAILYHYATDHAAQYGWAILDDCPFADFVEFCYRKSSKTPPCC